MTSASTNLKIHPDYCHSLSPTISKWVPLRATDVFALKDVGMFLDSKILYHHDNHPIKWVRLTGVVVAVDVYEKRRVYTVDDSSGMCIECTAVAPAEDKSAVAIAIPRHLDQLKTLNQMSNPTKDAAAKTKTRLVDRPADWQPSTQEPDVPWGMLDVGSIVKVKGKVGEFRDIKQIEVIKIEIMRGLDAEVKCWNEIMAFRTNILDKSWVVTEEEEARCRRVREKEMRRPKRGKETEEQRSRRKMAERKQREVRKGREEMERREAERKREREALMRPPPRPVSVRKDKGRIPLLALRQATPGT